MSTYNFGLISFYLLATFLFTKFSFFDPEYFLFFSSTALFLSISTFVNSFLESSISAKYDLYISRLEKVTTHFDELSDFLSSLESNFFSNAENFFLLIDSKLLELNSSFSNLFDDEYENAVFENLYIAELRGVAENSIASSNFFSTLNYSEFYETLILFIIQDPWRWKRRPRITKSFAFNKHFKTSKKFPAVAWPLKPGEYKLPRDWIDI